MKKILCALVWILCSQWASAQEGSLVDLKGEVRFDYLREYIDGDAVKSNSGFKGRYLNLIINGTINEHFSYAYRQRLNKASNDQSFFDATDWIHLTYRLNDQWSFNGGKQVVGIGGFEYDRSPIDLFFCSEYWNNISCYQFGVSTTYTTPQGNDSFLAQVCESPFNFQQEDLYAYNLMWYGSHDWYQSIWSLNAQEYRPGKFIYYIALGNQFTWGNVRLQLDYMNRATDNHAFFFKDFSIMSELSYRMEDKWNIFGKVTYDVNKTRQEGDYCVFPGTELTRVGVGLEYFPLKKEILRFHLFGCKAFGKNSNEAGTMLPKQAIVDLGVTLKVDMLKIARKF